MFMRRLAVEKTVAVSAATALLSLTHPAFSEDQAGVRTNGLSLMEAIASALQHNPSILLQQQQVDISGGALKEVSGRFDWTLGSSAGLGKDERPSAEDDRTDPLKTKADKTVNNYTAGLDKQFRSGISVSPNVQYTQTDDRDATNPNRDDTSLNFTVTVPLLKNRGREAAAGDEMAARATHEQSRFDLLDTVAVNILQTAQAYWEYAACAEELDILIKAEARAHKLISDTRRLIEADQRPAADIDQLEANLNDKVVQRISREQRLIGAQHDLGIAMGLPSREIDLLPRPTNSFPVFAEARLDPGACDEAFLHTACLRRADYKAAQQSEESARLLRNYAKYGKRHQLDLVLNSAYAGMDEGQGSENGSEYSAVIQYQVPLGNTEAGGTLMKREAEYQQAVIRLANTERIVRSGIILAYQQLDRSIQAWSHTRDSALSYQKAVSNEMSRLRAGLSTVLDVVSLEDKRQEAFIAEVEARQQCAECLLKLQYETGNIIQPGDSAEAIDLKTFMELPEFVHKTP